MDSDTLVAFIMGCIIGAFLTAITVGYLTQTEYEREIVGHGCGTYTKDGSFKWLKDNK